MFFGSINFYARPIIFIFINFSAEQEFLLGPEFSPEPIFTGGAGPGLGAEPLFFARAWAELGHDSAGSGLGRSFFWPRRWAASGHHLGRPDAQLLPIPAIISLIRYPINFICVSN